MITRFCLRHGEGRLYILVFCLRHQTSRIRCKPGDRDKIKRWLRDSRLQPSLTSPQTKITARGRNLTYSCDAHGEYKTLSKYKCGCKMMPSALEINEAGIKFRKSKTDKLLDIHFERGVLSMPVIKVVDSTESLYLNLMAFERLHLGAGDLVTAYVIFMDNMIVSAKDVAMLSSIGVLKNMLGCDEETAKLFNGTLSRRQRLMCPCRGLHEVKCDVNNYCSEPWHKWRATLIRTYFRNPWAFVSLAAAAILLIATVLQTVYTVMNKS